MNSYHLHLYYHYFKYLSHEHNQIDLKKDQVVKNGIIITFRFLAESNQEINKEINISLIKPTE